MRCANGASPPSSFPATTTARDRIAVGKSLLARHGIHIITELKDAFTPVEIGNIQIFPLPYFENAQMRDFLGDETLRGAGPACARR